MRKTDIGAAIVMCSLLQSCSMNKVQVSSSKNGQLLDQKEIYHSQSGGPAAASPQVNNGARCVDYAAETEVSEKSVAAWRLALDGHADQAMKMLDDLDKKYPSMKTVTFMKGQIQAHIGNKEEALKYYQAAVVGNEFDSMEVYKLAELQRQTGKNEQAIESYHKLLAVAPTFTPGHLGLAKVILKVDPKSAQARHDLVEIVDADPNEIYPETKEAKKLLQELKTTESKE